MIYRTKLLFITLITILSVVFVVEIVQKKVQKKEDRIFEEFTNRMNDNFEINEYIDNISFEESDLSIIYNLQLNKKFSDLPVYDQFGVLYTYCKLLRSYIMDADEERLLFNRGIHLTGNYKNITYQFDSHNQCHGIKSFKPEAVFFINGKLAYEEHQYMALMQDLECEIEIDYINGHSDKVIMEYSSRVFDLISNSGGDIGIEQDFEVVLNAVTDKFDITFEDYWDIYKKYYFCSCRYY